MSRRCVGRLALERPSDSAAAAAPKPATGAHRLEAGAAGPLLVAADAASGRSRSPRRTSSAPTPGGPPSLCARHGQQVGARGRRTRSARARRPAAASTWTSTPRSRQAATTSATGCTRADLVVAPLDVDERRCRGRTAASSSSGSTRPAPSTPTTVTSPCASRPSRTAECSTAASTWCAAPLAPRPSTRRRWPRWRRS